MSQKDSIKERFVKFLESKHLDSKTLTSFVDKTLPDILKQETDKVIVHPFENTDSEFYHELAAEVLINPPLQIQNEKTDGMLRDALYLLEAFYTSKYYKNCKLKPSKSPDLISHPNLHNNPLPTNTEIIEPQPKEKEMTEGAIKEMAMERAYRNLQARKDCIDKYQAQCQVCGIDFSEEYGPELGKGFIEVHHLVPISTQKENHIVDPLTDLVPLCPNCHAMIHRCKEGIMTLETLRSSYRGKPRPIKVYFHEKH